MFHVFKKSAITCPHRRLIRQLFLMHLYRTVVMFAFLPATHPQAMLDQGLPF
jgi:hypothetical protein